MHHIGHLPYKKKIETMKIDEIKKDFEKNKGLVSTDLSQKLGVTFYLLGILLFLMV